MKLCYVWIERFRNFEKLGFNISSSLKFNYDYETNNLTVKKVKELPENFFGERIKDVIGIIGKNGAGKSNAIELICKILKGTKTSLQTKYFIIIEEKGELKCYLSFGNNAEPNANFDISFEDYSGVINPLKVVFFSNVFDDRRNGFDKEVADISVNNLAYTNLLFKRNQISDFEKQIRLINSKVFSTLSIDLPKQVQFTSKVWSYNRFNSNSELYMYGASHENLSSLKKMFRDRLREIRPENKFIHLLRFGFFFEKIKIYLRRNRISSSTANQLYSRLNKFLEKLAALRTEEISERLLGFLENEFSKAKPEQTSLFSERDESKSVDMLFEIFTKQINFLKDIKKYVSKLKIDYSVEGGRNRGVEYFTFNYNTAPAKKFISEFTNLFGQTSFFDFNWIGISSGHKAYLNLFSSLYQELKFTRQPNLLLCIDEGDLYLHPMWQTEFFDKLLAVLPSIYSGEIQLILTSHSPFLLSDLPNQNVTILDKKNKNSSQDGINLKINTFGGNLYDLYSEPFFLGRKRTSDFAYNKIINLIESAENKELSRQDKKNLNKIADLIGDEIVRFGLKRLLNND